MSVIDDIKARIDIVDLVSESVELKRSGRNFSGFCPFHPNSKTPAFFVSPDKQTWRCFGACSDGGDVFSFVMKQEGIDFREALERLSIRTGVELPEYKPQKKSAAQKESRNKHLTLLTEAADYFHDLLYHAPEAEHARQYVRKRKLSRGSVNHFLMGYSLDSWDACKSHFEQKGYTENDLLAVGLLTVNEEKGRVYDRFRDRLMFPIRDKNGQVVGFGARTLSAEGIPKYLNSPQTEWFDKSHILYGLDMAKRAIRDHKEAVVVEGYMDVIRAHQGGFKNVVAQMGTAFTETQLNLLKRYTKRFIIALDADEAGFNATMRSLDVARATLDREYEVHFDARGLVKQESRLKADIRAVTMPDGKDPDDVIRENPDQWVDLIKNAPPIIKFVMDVVTAEVDLTDPKAKTAIAERLIPLIQEVASSVEREHYWTYLSTRLQVSTNTLKALQPTKKRTNPIKKRELKRPRPSKSLPKQFLVAPRAIKQLETNYLRQSSAYPHIMVEVDKRLQRLKQPIVTKSDFLATVDQMVWISLRKRALEITISSAEDETIYTQSLEPTLQTRFESLLKEPVVDELQLDRLGETLTLSVLSWRLEKMKRDQAEYKNLFKIAIENNDQEARESYLFKIRELNWICHALNVAVDALQNGDGTVSP